MSFLQIPLLAATWLTNALTVTRRLAKSKLFWSLALIIYLLLVWYAAWSQSVTSWDRWPNTVAMSCPQLYTYTVRDKHRPPNPWLLETRTPTYLDKSVLDNPTCLGAYLADIAAYKYYASDLLIYDSHTGTVLFHISKHAIH